MDVERSAVPQSIRHPPNATGTALNTMLSSFLPQVSTLPFRDLWSTDCPTDPGSLAVLQPVRETIAAFFQNGHVGSQWDRLTVAARTAPLVLDTEPMLDPPSPRNM